MSSQQGAPRVPPNLQPKPIAISPIRHQMQNVSGRPMLTPISARGNLTNQTGQQFMVGTVSGAVPINVSQPRMTAQVLQQSQRMAMYVPSPGSPLSQNVPKIVTGVPLYQNQIRIQPNALNSGGTLVRTINSAMLQSGAKPSHVTIVPSSHGKSVIQSPSGQFQQLQAHQIAATQLIPAGSGLTNQINLQRANQIQANTGLANQINLQRANQIQGSSFGIAGGLRPAGSLQTVTSSSQIFRVSPMGALTPVAVPTSSQMVATVGQIPRPTYLTSQTSPYLSQQSNSTPLSPLVPISPKMFQVARPVGAQTRVFSPPNMGAVQPAILGFRGQQCAIGQPIFSQGAVYINSVPLTISSPLVGTLPTPSGSSVEIPDDNPDAAITEEESPMEETITVAPLQSVDTDQGKENVGDGVEEIIADASENEVNYVLKDDDYSVVADKDAQQNDIDCHDKCDGIVVETEQERKDEETEKNGKKKMKTADVSDGAVGFKDNSTDNDDGYEIVENFQDILKLKRNTDPDRYIKLEEKQISYDLDKFKYNNDEAKMPGRDIYIGTDLEGLNFSDDIEFEDEEFIWENYLLDIGAKAAPSTAFKHVEYSLTSGFVQGMKLEVPNKCAPDTYWVASVLNTCGPLLRLHYDGYEDDSSGDFWCDVSTSEVHPIGWCAQNGKNWQPPDKIKDKYENWKEFLMTSLTGANTAPMYLLDKETGITPIDQLKCGMRLEVQDNLNPMEVWLVQILENVGGRLFLRLEGTDSASKHFWMFYLNVRLHNIGWGKENGCIYSPPKDIQDEHSPIEWNEILKAALIESETCAPPSDVFKDQAELKPHKFEVGMKLEAINPTGHNMITPATIRRVINEKYFIIEFDDLRPKEEREVIRMCCHSEYLGIFPVSWCQCKGIRLVPPPGWNRPDFLWSEYLSFCCAKAAPERFFNSVNDDHEFERGMKLEAVNPAHPNQICAATITKIVGNLLWIHLDNTKDVPSHIEDVNSHNLFPIGWCESNGVELKPPRKSRFAKGRVRHISTLTDGLSGEAFRSHTFSHVKSGNNGGSWCPKLYINHRCFSGPYLSKGRISELPKSVGPGPMGLVLKSVITLLIGVAYKSCRVLKELQLDGELNPRMQQQILKAKYKGKSYRASVELCRNDAQLEEFCRNICIKLECCPYLFSVLHVKNNCPENCQQLTKTKYNYNYGKKKRKAVGRPPLYSKLDRGLPKLGIKRGRKKKRFHLIHKKSHAHTAYIPKLMRDKEPGDDVFVNGEGRDEGFIDDEQGWDSRDVTPSKKRKYTHHVPAPSDIQTRGAKLPKYSFERKTHKKILLSSASPPLKPKTKVKQNLTPQKVETFYDGRILMPREESLQLDSNPLHWSVDRVVSFIKSTDCSHLARIIKEQEIDGQALMLMSLPVIQEHMELKLGPAVKLCHLIERLKVSFYENYA